MKVYRIREILNGKFVDYYECEVSNSNCELMGYTVFTLAGVADYLSQRDHKTFCIEELKI